MKKTNKSNSQKTAEKKSTGIAIMSPPSPLAGSRHDQSERVVKGKQIDRAILDGVSSIPAVAELSSAELAVVLRQVSLYLAKDVGQMEFSDFTNLRNQFRNELPEGLQQAFDAIALRRRAVAHSTRYSVADEFVFHQGTSF